jgi:hypothetical protein
LVEIVRGNKACKKDNARLLSKASLVQSDRTLLQNQITMIEELNVKHVKEINELEKLQKSVRVKLQREFKDRYKELIKKFDI